MNQSTGGCASASSQIESAPAASRAVASATNSPSCVIRGGSLTPIFSTSSMYLAPDLVATSSAAVRPGRHQLQLRGAVRQYRFEHSGVRVARDRRLSSATLAEDTVASVDLVVRDPVIAPEVAEDREPPRRAGRYAHQLQAEAAALFVRELGSPGHVGQRLRECGGELPVAPLRHAEVHRLRAAEAVHASRPAPAPAP